MKKILNILVLTLALNFLAVVGAAGFLWQSGRVDAPKAAAIREIVFPKPTTQPAADADAPATRPATQPSFMQLDALLAKHAGKRTGEQVELIQQTFDAQSAMLDRRRRELDALQAQVAVQQKALAEASEALAADRQKLDAREAAAQNIAADQGFKDSLKLYETMPPKQAKTIFMGMPDEAVVPYLRAMQSRTAAKILREFKGPEEQDRLARLMEQIRQATPATQPAAAPPGPAPLAGSAGPGA